jgi:hypothetical protein
MTFELLKFCWPANLAWIELRKPGLNWVAGNVGEEYCNGQICKMGYIINQNYWIKKIESSFLLFLYFVLFSLVNFFYYSFSFHFLHISHFVLFSLISFFFRWFRFYFVLFSLILFRFVFIDFVSFRFRCFRIVSFLFRFALYRYPFKVIDESRLSITSIDGLFIS